MLSKIQERSRTVSYPPYKFQYNSGNIDGITTPGIDFWGYANGNWGNQKYDPKIVCIPRSDSIRTFPN